MAVHLYLSLIPESLVASMLPPEAFGAYLATGTRKRSHGQAIFFDLDPDFRSDYFRLDGVKQRCVPHPDGRPKHSVYASIYRVLEHVPLTALGSLWLVTRHGAALALQQSPTPEEGRPSYHLYQELCPVHPLIASTLSPSRFCRLITDPRRAICVPRICFVELDLGGLAEDPAAGLAENLPYGQVEHLRNCLTELNAEADKHTKTVDRVCRRSFLYRCVSNGFYVGDQEEMIYYPYPSQEELETKYFQWWRCANDAELEHV